VNGTDNQDTIAACTELLGREGLSTKQRSTYYAHRALAYCGLDQVSNAIADLHHADQLGSRDGLVDLVWGLIEESALKQTDRALRDYSAAIALSGDDNELKATALRCRGLLERKLGNAAQAERDLAAAAAIDPNAGS
jgi:tetratricopeptide (TPR) repeat protein